MSLADYLAKNYLTADVPASKHGKKRKRKDRHDERHTAESTGLVIADDESGAWQQGAEELEHQNEDGPTVVNAVRKTTQFRKAKNSSWKIIGNPAPSNEEQAAADAILASAAAEREAFNHDDDDDPVFVNEDGSSVPQQTLKDARARAPGAVSVDTRHEDEDEEEPAATTLASHSTDAAAHETIYRDASGRIINVAMKRAEARRKTQEEERRRQEAEEADKGHVQRAEAAERKKALRDAKFMSVARHADDEQMNAELKRRDRWNDPAAGFLSSTGAQTTSISGKPLYQGPSAPNRYGIRPGHRWDGVDRSNGFEKKYFAAQNRMKNRAEMEYKWQMDE